MPYHPFRTEQEKVIYSFGLQSYFFDRQMAGPVVGREAPSSPSGNKLSMGSPVPSAWSSPGCVACRWPFVPAHAFQQNEVVMPYRNANCDHFDTTLPPGQSKLLLCTLLHTTIFKDFIPPKKKLHYRRRLDHRTSV